jgi:hypothetical protein
MVRQRAGGATTGRAAGEGRASGVHGMRRGGGREGEDKEIGKVIKIKNADSWPFVDYSVLLFRFKGIFLRRVR